MQSKSSLWKRRCGRNHGFEMFHGSWALRWLHDDSLHTETKMRHKRSKWICKNWVIVYISSFPCCCHREVLVDKMGIDESFSLVSSRGSCWVIMVSEKFGDMLDLICFVRSIYRSQPTSIFHPFLVGGNSTTRSSIWNCCHKISSLADTVMKILSYSME